MKMKRFRRHQLPGAERFRSKHQQPFDENRIAVLKRIARHSLKFEVNHEATTT
jgi:hypothetical protein